MTWTGACNVVQVSYSAESAGLANAQQRALTLGCVWMSPGLNNQRTCQPRPSCWSRGVASTRSPR